MKPLRIVVVSLLAGLAVIYPQATSAKIDCAMHPEKCWVLVPASPDLGDLVHADAVGVVVENIGTKAAALRYIGGKMRKGVLTNEHSVPDAGLGLYIYLLPQREVGVASFRALEAFHFCLRETTSKDAPIMIALLLLPTRVTGDKPPVVDLELSSDLLRQVKSVEDIDAKEVYLIMTNAPIEPGKPPATVIEITMGRVAPQYLGTWLSRFQEQIESGDLRAPATAEFALRTILAIAGSAKDLVAVDPAEAAAFECR